VFNIVQLSDPAGSSEENKAEQPKLDGSG